MDIEDDLLYVGSLDGLHIFRLRGEDDLEEIGWLEAERAWHFRRIGQWAYVLGRFPELRGTRLIAVDLTNPAAPVVRGSFPVRLGVPVVFVISDNLAVIRSEGTDGIEIVEIRDGHRFVQLGQKRFPEYPFVDAIALDGRRLYSPVVGQSASLNWFVEDSPKLTAARIATATEGGARIYWS